jgi:ketosteroid isomerase-like protein
MIGTVMVKKAVRSAFANLNRSDIESFMKDWTENAVFRYPTCVRAGGTIQGKGEIKRWFEGWVEQFPKREFVLHNVCVRDTCAFGGTNVIAAEWDVKLWNKDGKDFEMSGVTVVEAIKGKAVRVCDYIRESKLLREAWGEK